MPCHRCGARQTDPVRGASPWRRGVRRGAQVLICPECQRGRDWAAELARCAACGSARLVRALGRTVCKDCGAEDRVVEAAEPVGSGELSGELSGEVSGGTSGDAIGSSSSDTRGAELGAPPDDVASPESSDAARLAAEVQAALERQRRSG